MTSITFLIAAVALIDSTPCQKAPGLDAGALLRRAAERTGFSRMRDSVLKTVAFEITQHQFESDRMYPPALAEVGSLDMVFDPARGVERTATKRRLVDMNSAE